MEIRVWMIESKWRDYVNSEVKNQTYVQWDDIVEKNSLINRRFFKTDNVYDPVLDILDHEMIDYIDVDFDCPFLTEPGIRTIDDCEVFISIKAIKFETKLRFILNCRFRCHDIDKAKSITSQLLKEVWEKVSKK